MKNNVLVTGGTGFLGMHIIFQLLQKGYHVKTTVRSLKSKDNVIKILKNNGITDFTQLSFVELDLSQDAGWKEAMLDCEYVLSVASPVFFGKFKNEDELIRPAIDGITRILKAAKAAKVKRVVMTSNFGAIGFSNSDKTSITTEAFWTDEFAKGLSAYEKSKLIAEKEAWKFMENETELEFATINPVAIFGPSQSSHVSGSFDLLKNLLNGSMKRVINIPLNVVDARDVADLHIRAMITKEANGERFIASADGEISMEDIAHLLRQKRPELISKMPQKTLPNVAIRAAALFNKHAKEGKLMINMNRQISNEKAKKMLGWTPISTKEEAVLAAVDSLAKYGLLD
ncbi:NAD-dependent epimerase/dehydratase family protein [Listeria sp. FSL L7-1425]|uniref:NAD-dependent epimerase/dehydratase family protein n=1 Tax=Listeria cossartiae TaxID=2838249 RepID=UPI0016249E96|nr:NAD-dependent epimerase/dehydratase family protein [Listeria cossartiae]MBC1568942.1 NAD-dependent epimerase/dehydratase family protein [Listeria cossartiae subsp. cossartiae]